MRKLCIVLGFICAIIAVVLATTPLANLSILPAIAAIVFGVLLYFISKKTGQSKKTVQYIVLLAVISICISTYKTIFSTVELGDTEELQERAKASEEDSKDILEELEID